MEWYALEEVKASKHTRISYEAIYDWVYNEDGGSLGLYVCLRRKQKKRIRRYSRKKRKKGGSIPNRVLIENRPESKKIGHREVDSVIDSGKSTLSVHYERQTMKTLIRKYESKRA